MVIAKVEDKFRDEITNAMLEIFEIRNSEVESPDNKIKPGKCNGGTRLRSIGESSEGVIWK